MLDFLKKVLQKISIFAFSSPLNVIFLKICIFPELHHFLAFSATLNSVANRLLVLLQGPFFYLALLHGNLYLVHTTDVTAFVPMVSEGQTLNDGAYHTVKIELGPTQ